MKRIINIILVSALFVVPLVGLPAMAHEGDPTDDPTDSTGTDTNNETETETETNDQTEKATDDQKGEEVKDRIEGRLNEVKQKVCDRRHDVIEKIMTNASEQGTRHLAVFDKILQRVKDFYEEKNLNVANYDELVQTTTDAHDAAEEAVNSVDDNVNFDCEGDNPIGQVDKFNGSLRNMHKDLKDFRETIKNLIVGILSQAQKAEQSDGGSE